MTSQRQAFAVNELNDENQMLGEALVHSRKQAELYENNMEQITREYRKKINEANHAKLESDLRHRNTEHDTVKRLIRQLQEYWGRGYCSVEAWIKS